MVITSLIESLLREVDIPLVLQEIEGDAVFLYATCESDDDAEWREIVEQVRTKLLRFFESFIEARVAVAQMTACQCAICVHADELKLKLVVHSGRAVFHSIGSRQQASGTDVILAHRLLKNSVADSEYLLLSDAAHREFGTRLGLEFHEGQETYDNLGTTKTHVHFLTPEVDRARDAFLAQDATADKAAIDEYMRFGTANFLPAAVRQLRHPTSETGWLRRVLFLLGWLVYAPIFRLRYPGEVVRNLQAKRAQAAGAVGNTATLGASSQ